MLSQQIKNSGSLLDCIDAVRNWRAVLLLLITLVAAALVMGLGVLLSGVSFVFVFLFALLAYAVVFYGANAVGVMVMDEARGHASRPMLAAVLNSLSTSHRLILVLLLLGALYLVGLLVLALVLLICKIPFLGPVLYTVVFPVSVVIVGIAMFALPTVVMPLSAPSIWNGATTMQCVSQLVAIARKRLIMVLIMMIAVAFISGIVGFLIGAILVTGSLVTAGLSAPILGGGMGGMMGGMGGMGGMMAGMANVGGHAVAAGVGGGILFAAAFTLPGMVYLRGASTVYLRAIEGLDLASEQAAIDEKIAAARNKAREVQEQAQAAAQKYAQPAPPSAPVAPGAPTAPIFAAPPAPVAPPVVAPAPAPMAPPPYVPPPAPVAPAPEAFPPTQPVALVRGAPMALKCPKCAAPCVPGDAFCGECGTRLT